MERRVERAVLEDRRLAVWGRAMEVGRASVVSDGGRAG